MPRNYDNAAPTQYQRIPEHTRDAAWIKELLARCEIGHIAHERNGQPFITPTNFWYDETGQRVIFHSNIAGRLRDNLEHNPRVCLEVSEYGRFLPANTALEFSIQYRSVMVYGTVSIINEPEEAKSVLYQLLKKYFPKMEAGREFQPITPKEIARTTVYALTIESWSGKENWAEKADELPDWPPLPEEFK